MPTDSSTLTLLAVAAIAAVGVSSSTVMIGRLDDRAEGDRQIILVETRGMIELVDQGEVVGAGRRIQGEGEDRVDAGRGRQRVNARCEVNAVGHRNATRGQCRQAAE